MKHTLLLILLAWSVQAFAQDSSFKKNASAAATLLDLEFTATELEMMLPDLRENLTDYKKLHAISLNNSVGMGLALQLKPDQTRQAKIKWSYDKQLRLPKNQDDLAFYSIRQLGSLLRNNAISSEALTLFFLGRLKKYGDSLQCVISITEDIALSQARQADADFKRGIDRGPLQGIPYGLKDLFAVKGTKTTWGAAPYKEQRIEEDAYVYARLRDAGAVLVAKLTLGALAMGDYWFGGKTKNPWNTQQGSSGSSAGSASATVAGLVPFAIGTETYGSIISPSHTCGATGLRPTFGSISRSGAMTLSWSLDKIGPICRSAEDAAAVFSFLHGTDGRDASAVFAAFNPDPRAETKKLRVGYAKNYFNQLDTAAQEWGVIKALSEAGIHVEPMHFPDSGVYRFDMIGMVIGAEAASAFDAFTRTGLDDQMTRQTRFDWPNYFRVARTIPATAYINANRHRTLLMEEINKAMEEYDVVITPSFAGRQLAITNLTGHPALCMPIGLNKQGVPNSITFLSGLFKEEALLALGKFFQEITPHEEIHPPKFK
jgi:Asp-tRNA(Asn)/Glu-tRNA(Gln) amidotransferase A subunit family amidase